MRTFGCKLLIFLILSASFFVFGQAENTILVKGYGQFDQTREIGVNRVGKVNSKSTRPINRNSAEANLLIATDDELSKSSKYSFLYLITVQPGDLVPIGDKFYRVHKLSEDCQCAWLSKEPVRKQELAQIGVGTIFIPLIQLTEYSTDYQTAEISIDKTYKLRTDRITNDYKSKQNNAQITFWDEKSKKRKSVVVKTGDKIRLGKRVLHVSSIVPTNYDNGILGWVTLSF